MMLPYASLILVKRVFFVSGAGAGRQAGGAVAAAAGHTALPHRRVIRVLPRHGRGAVSVAQILPARSAELVIIHYSLFIAKQHKKIPRSPRGGRGMFCVVFYLRS